MDALYWSPHHSVHDTLQSYMHATKEAALKKLDAHRSWLLGGLTCFKQPNEESRKLVKDGKAVSLSKGKKFPVDPKLRTAALQLSTLLVRTGIPPHH